MEMQPGKRLSNMPFNTLFDAPVPSQGTLPTGGFMGGQPLRDPNMPSYMPVDPMTRYASGTPIKTDGGFVNPLMTSSGGTIPTGGFMGGQPGYPGSTVPNLQTTTAAPVRNISALREAMAGDDRAITHGVANSGGNTYLGAYDQAHTDLYNQYAQQARDAGITDPNEIDARALAASRENWYGQSNAGGSWMDAHPWAMFPIMAAAAYGGAGLMEGGLGSAAAGAGEAGAAGGAAGGVGAGASAAGAAGGLGAAEGAAGGGGLLGIGAGDAAAGAGAVGAGSAAGGLGGATASGAAAGAAGGASIPSAILNPLIGAGLGAVTGGSGGTPQAGTPAGGLLGTGMATGPGSLSSTIGAGLGAYGQYQNAQELRDATQQGIERTDPFGPQRQMYQGMLADSYNNPNFFNNNPVLQGIRNTTQNDVSRQMASRGYNMSGREMSEMGSRLQDESMRYALPFQQQLAQNAGANINPGNVGQLGLEGAKAVGTADANTRGNISNFLTNLFGGGQGAAGANGMPPGMTPAIQSYLQNLFGQGNGGGGSLPTPPINSFPMPDFGGENPLPSIDYGQYF